MTKTVRCQISLLRKRCLKKVRLKEGHVVELDLLSKLQHLKFKNTVMPNLVTDVGRNRRRSQVQPNLKMMRMINLHILKATQKTVLPILL